MQAEAREVVKREMTREKAVREGEHTVMEAEEAGLAGRGTQVRPTRGQIRGVGVAQPSNGMGTIAFPPHHSEK